MEIERLSARVDVDTTRATAKLEVFDQKLDDVADDRNAHINVNADDTKIHIIDRNLDQAAENRTATINVIPMMGGKRFGPGFDLMDELDIDLSIDAELKIPKNRTSVAEWISEGFSDGMASAIRKFEGAGLGKILTLRLPGADDRGGVFDLSRDRNNSFQVIQRGMVEGAEALVGVFDTLGDAMGSVMDAADGMNENLMGVTGMMTDVGESGSGAGKGMSSMGTSMSGGAAAAAGLVAILAILIPTLIAAGTAILALGAYVVGLVAAFVPLVGLLGILPGLLLGAGAGMAIMMAAFKDVLPAIQEVIGAQDNLVENEIAEANAARNVEAANRAKAKAVLEYAQARRNAAEAIEDAQFAAQSAQLSEERAILGLERAYQRLADVQGNVGDKMQEVTKVTDDFTGKQFEVARITYDAVDAQDDIRDALLGVREAELSLAMARDAKEDTQLRLNDLTTKGIEGSDILADATQRLADAEWAAEEAVRAHNEARDAVTGKGGAYEKISPAAQEFVDLIASLKPLWDEFKTAVEETIFPALTIALDEAMPVLEEITPMLQPVLDGIANLIRGFSENFFTDQNIDNLVTFFEGFGEDLGELGPIFADFMSGFLALIVAAEPLVDTLMTEFADLGKRFKEWAEGDSEMGDLGPWFEQTGEVVSKTLDILFSFMTFLTGFMTAIEPFSTWVLDGLVDGMSSLSDYVNSEDGQSAIGDFFERMKPAITAIGDLMGAIMGAFTQIFGSEEAVDFMVEFANVLKDDLLPVLGGMVDTMIKSGFLTALVEVMGSLVAMMGANMQMAQMDIFLKGLGKILQLMEVVIDFFTTIMTIIAGVGDIALTPIDMLLDILDIEGLSNYLEEWFKLLPGLVLTWLAEAMPSVDFTGIWDGIKDAFIAMLNSVIDIWNDMKIPSFSIGGWQTPFGKLPTWDSPQIDFPDIKKIGANAGTALGPPAPGVMTLADVGDNVINPYTGDFLGGNGGWHPPMSGGTTVNNTFNEKVDSHEVSNQIVWDLRNGPR